MQSPHTLLSKVAITIVLYVACVCGGVAQRDKNGIKLKYFILTAVAVVNSGSFCGICGQCVLSVEYFLDGVV